MTLAGTQLDTIEQLYRLDVGNGCPVAIAAAVLRPDQWGVKRVVSGRGFSDEDAVNGCMFEAIERKSAVFSPRFEVARSTVSELAENAVHPKSILQISDTQYAQAPEWNKRVDANHQLPPCFDDQQNVGWVKAKSSTTQSTKFVPAACCFLGYPQAVEERFPIPDSSGLAAGQNVEDAIERALYELIERDAISIWWYNRLKMPRLDRRCEKLSLWVPFNEWIVTCERRFWLLDLMNDLSVPVVAAISCNQNGSDLSFGFAAASTAERAAENAMCELVQFEATKIYNKQNTARQCPDFLTWCRSAPIEHHSFLHPHTASPKPGNHAVGRALLDELKIRGLEVITVDLSEPDSRIKVVRMIVPGLRQIWPRFASGRLFDVPVNLGWRQRPLSEIELNPTPILY